MQEMVEPDRTILIVSIIGLVVIWGSVAYHKFVQGNPAEPEAAAPSMATVADESQAATQASDSPAPAAQRPAAQRLAGKPRGKGKGKRR